MPKRKRPLEVPNPKRIDVLVPTEVVDQSKEILAQQGVSLSSFIRRQLNRLVEYPDLVLIELESIPEVGHEKPQAVGLYSE